MIHLKLILFTAILFCSNVTPKIILANSFLKIHSMRNITNFERNFNQIESFVEKLKESEEGLEIKSFRESLDIFHKNKTKFSKDFIGQIQVMYHKNVIQCRKSIEKTKNKAMNNFRKSVRKFEKNTRVKRGIPILGELLSEITDQPSPSEWSNEKKIISDLERLVKNEYNETHQLVSEMESQEKTLEKLVPDLRKLSKNLKFSKNQIHLISLIILDNLNFQYACDEGKEMAKELLNESKTLKQIQRNAMLKRQDVTLFPLKKLVNIEKHRKNSKITTPILSNEHEILQLYEMSTAVTIIDQKVIHSLISIPFADFTYEYEYIPYPILNEKDIGILHMLSKLALKPIDIFTCSKTQRNIRLFSSKDLLQCNRTPAGKLYVCLARTSVVPTSHHSCKNFKLPKSLMIQLTPNLLLIKTDQKSLTEKCRNVDADIQINSTYSILNVPKNCEIYGENFSISKYGQNEIEIEQLTSTIVAKTFEFPENLIYINDTEIELIHQNLTFNIFNMKKGIEKAKKLDRETNFSLKKIQDDHELMNNDFTQNHHFKRTVFSIFGLVTLATMGLLVSKAYKIYKNRVAKKPNNSEEPGISVARGNT